MVKLCILADRITADGLMLGGVKDVIVVDEANVAERIKNVAPETKMLLITSSLAAAAGDALARAKKAGINCTIIPDMASGQEDTTKSLIKGAIGFELG